ncbi:MAG: glycosyltransferase family 9 protein [Planctomycetia bacterium]|jgi:heptosyltransferase-2
MESPRRIAVILPRWVGDVCMATPLLRGLRAHFGAGTRITGVMRPLFADLLAGTPWLDDAILYDRHKRDPAVGFRAAAAALRRLRADVAVVLPGSLSAAALAWAGGARRRVGFGGNWRRPLLTDVVRGPAGAMLAPPEAFALIGRAIGLADGPLDLELATTPADEERADAVLAGLFPGFVPGASGPLVVLNDNSSNGSARAWGGANHAALARWLTGRLPGSRVLVHCGPGDRPQAREVVALADNAAVRGLGDVDDLPLGLSKAIYRRAALAITSDSGPRHIAAAFGVPTVALIGPTDPLSGRSAPGTCREIRLDLPCAPCAQAVCPLGHHDCMRLIAVEQVGAAALELLGAVDRPRRMIA